MKNTIYMLNSVTNTQMNSFIVTTSDGKVIVIDGGFRPDAENMISYLKMVTNQEVPHIDAWILTHAHIDHISCINEIVEKHPDKITFDKVMFNFPSIQFCKKENTRCDSSVEDFNKNFPIIAGKVVTVYLGDSYDIGEAHIDILYSPNGEIRCNHVNNTSVIFMLTLGSKKILFLGDAGVEEGQRCASLYKGTDTLKADYVQMAHHGQQGVDFDFYKEVSPKACLWCTPDWLWNNDAGQGYNTHIWKTVEVRSWMESLGVKEHYVMKDGVQVIEV